MNYCKCLKCGKITNLEETSKPENWGRGCPSCQSKKIQLKLSFPLDDYNIDFVDLIYNIDECSQCHQPKVIDIPNWEEIKDKMNKNAPKTKQEAIKELSNEVGDDTCHCDNREREREREREQIWLETLNYRW